METIAVFVIRVSSYKETTVIFVIGVCTYMETSHLVTGASRYMEQQSSWLQELEGIWRRKL
jgi:hypothetical protein